MCKLRKVKFRFGPYEFHPNSTEQERQEMEDYSKERDGYFHRWVDDVETNKEIPYVKTLALIEDTADGKVYVVDFNNVNFTEKP